MVKIGELNDLINQLIKETNKDPNKVDKLLDDINSIIIKKELVISYNNNKITLKPLWIESYCQGNNYYDESTHANEEQYNNQFKLYFHRVNQKGRKPGRKAGVDFVLSNDDNVAYSILLKFTYCKETNKFYTETYLPSLLKEKLKIDYKDFVNYKDNPNSLDLIIQNLKKINIELNDSIFYPNNNDKSYPSTRQNVKKSCKDKKIARYLSVIDHEIKCKNIYRSFINFAKKMHK